MLQRQRESVKVKTEEETQEWLKQATYQVPKSMVDDFLREVGRHIVSGFNPDQVLLAREVSTKCTLGMYELPLR